VKFVNKRDILIISGLLAVAIIVLVFISYSKKSQPDVLYAQIYYGKTVVKTVPLDKDQVFSIPEKPKVVFEIKNHAIAFTQSNCPDQVCVHAGWLSKVGDFAACMPNSLSVWVVDKKST
jgi:Uncharacterized protein conserved in bacteria